MILFRNLRLLLAALLTALALWPLAARCADAPGAKLMTTSGRAVFWRGEQIGLTFSAPLAAPAAVRISLSTGAAPTAQSTIYQGEVTPVKGNGWLNVLLPSNTLGDGQYIATAQCGETTATATFTVRDTTVASPGMIIDESGTELAPNAKLAGQTGMVAFMNDGFTGATASSSAEQMNRIFDNFTDQQILFWSQDATRPFSFYPPSSSPNTNDEYLRRLMLGNTIMMRYPAFAGQLFDYDPTGFLNFYNGLATYWQWGKLREPLMQYLQGQEDALYQNFRKETGMEPLSDAEAMTLAAALHSPEGMGYIDMPTRRWANEIAARSPQMDAKQLDDLKRRGVAWYSYLMTMNKRRYTGYLPHLRDIDPTLRFSTSNTINHTTPRNGGNHGESYQPLDFRYVAVWDDQGGAPEHIYETVLAASLLNINRSSAQPLWIDTVQGWLNGNLFRNAVQVAGRGGQGTGYAMEEGANLGAYPNGNGHNALLNNAPRNQEYAANAKLMARFGGVFAHARHTPRVGLLYTNAQGIATPYAQSYCDGLYKMLYLLSHVGLPPALVSETMLERGLPGEMDTLIVLRQSEELPAGAMKGLRDFVARGGRVIADTATTVSWDFLERSDALNLPFRDLGHPYNMFTAYNRQDATVGVMHELAAKRCPQLRALLQSSIAHVSLDATDPDVAVSTLRGGAASFVTVADDSLLDFSRIFTPEQQASSGSDQLCVGYGKGAIGSWMPLRTELLLSPAAGDNTAVYDLFAGRQVKLTSKGGGRVTACDLSTAPARIFAVYPTAVGAGRLAATQRVTAGQPIALRYQATSADGAPLAAVVPVALTLRAPGGAAVGTLYRATDEHGVLDDCIPTGQFTTPGAYQLLVRQALDGQGISLPVTVKAGAPAKAALAPRVAVRDPERLRQFLASKPEIVVPVFDAANLPSAKQAIDGLVKQGVTARLWMNPPLVDYALAYVVKPEEQPHNDAVDHGEAIGKVQFQNNVHHLNGNFYGSAMTGYRYGKHILLLGVAGNNPVLNGVAASGLLWTDQSTRAPGGALVQYLPWALGRNADTLVVLGADADGLAAGVAALLSPPTTDPVTDGVRAARAQMLQQHALPLPTATTVATPVSAKGGQILPPEPSAAARDFSLTAVTDVQELGNKLVVTLGRYGDMLALVKRDNTAATVTPAFSSTSQVACGKSIVVTVTPGMTFAWTADGTPCWRALGEFKAVLPGTDDVIVESNNSLYRVSLDGNSTPIAAAPAAAPKPEPVFKAEPVTERQGNAVVLKEVRVTDTRSGKAINGFALTAVNTRPPWETPQYKVKETLLAGAGGHVALAYYRYAGEHAVQLYNAETATVSKVALDTAYLTDAAISRDERYVALSGMEGEVRVVDLTGKEAARLQVGAFPRLFPLAGSAFAVGTADGQLAVIDAATGEHFTRDLAAEPAPNPAEAYRQIRAIKLLAWSTPPVAQGALPFDAFYWYLRDEDGTLKMVNWGPGKAAIDFRWMDTVQGQVQIPQAKTYTVTVRAAAKYFDEQPMAQPSWAAILEMRAKVVHNERPAPAFRLLVDGKPVATLTPAGGTLQPFVTKANPEGWASLTPSDAEITTFTTTTDLPAGSHLIGLEAVNMQDCYAKEFSIR